MAARATVLLFLFPTTMPPVVMTRSIHSASFREHLVRTFDTHLVSSTVAENVYMCLRNMSARFTRRVSFTPCANGRANGRRLEFAIYGVVFTKSRMIAVTIFPCCVTLRKYTWRVLNRLIYRVLPYGDLLGAFRCSVICLKLKGPVHAGGWMRGYPTRQSCPPVRCMLLTAVVTRIGRPA
jgi:hypothetical protein